MTSTAERLSSKKAEVYLCLHSKSFAAAEPDFCKQVALTHQGVYATTQACILSITVTSIKSEGRKRLWM